MNKYDAVIVVGSQPDLVTWKLPEQVYQCLDRAQEILVSGKASYIITSGKWSIVLDNIGLKQPFRECDVMTDYLIMRGVPVSKILKETKSKDSISNLYYLKTEILIPKSFKNILFITADFRIPRLEFLCQRILGNEYSVDFETVTAIPSSSYNEPNTFRVQKDFLEPMQDGDHTWLADKFYTAPMYKYWAEHDKQKHDKSSA
ncbi:MAG: YdcF family protein [bacterium]|nr:YdcF family protein [bacterium]